MQSDNFVGLDLGAGRNPMPGCIAVDRFPLEGIDVVADLDGPLGFKSDSVDFVIASHSLEHVAHLMETMREIYRICKHGAQICIVAPYAAQGLNYANPYHKQVFNEHTPRFWTATDVTTVDASEYFHPHAGNWGLIESDSSAPDIDIRCVRMEFFYFPAYRHLTVDEQRLARKRYTDVCDQMMYHLLVIKRDITREEFLEMARETEFYEPYYVTIRKLQERTEQLELENARLRQKMIAISQRTDDDSRGSGQRTGRLGGFIPRLTGNADSSNEPELSPAFEPMKNDWIRFEPKRSGFILGVSGDLRQVTYESYALPPLPHVVTAILLAPVLESDVGIGVLGIEIISIQNNILATATIPASVLRTSEPALISIEPTEIKKGSSIRVFVQNVTSVIRVREWQRPQQTQPQAIAERKLFCAFEFQS